MNFIGSQLALSRIEVVIVRTGERYGPADLRLLQLFKATKRGRYITLGSSLNERQLIYVEDLCRALLAAAQAPAAVVSRCRAAHIATADAASFLLSTRTFFPYNTRNSSSSTEEARVLQHLLQAISVRL